MKIFFSLGWGYFFFSFSLLYDFFVVVLSVFCLLKSWLKGRWMWVGFRSIDSKYREDVFFVRKGGTVVVSG